MIVQQIFAAINNTKVNYNGTDINISISMGVSAISEADMRPNDLYSRVDDNLYHSKNNGRMQITAD